MTSASIIKLSDVFLVTFQGELSDRDALTLREDLAKRVSGTGACGVLIDVSGLELVDSFLARTLHELAEVCALLAARTVVVGMRPEVAFALVELGLTLPDLETALNVDEGLSLLDGTGPR
ncbi:STAS domain-containing protein [Saccharomonospora viridis]|uniref:Anti-anti-sigma regulatory factor (Antagonist of anti-sigma factor) n=1 Tax=Saccharomonospora viridis (strain ATCC 15386 / DSM 43017 / JCM 3036 / CCUG 5913 / NBRC 12207 / NCIMB 9602 / P101) TaxID=471857 RepID=C7MYT5_SACVD|nr:STAS domain-containing protein [Saccharomonospora viridis]ACU98174.1 anti-anti-sigma regulatory factor (antagonist of anti-sigma factor) [Saccharomonospora viridis DSM 43017]